MNKLDWKSNPGAIRDTLIILIIAIMLLVAGISITIYDNEITSMLHESNDTGLPINWHGRYYQITEVERPHSIDSANWSVMVDQ